MKSLEQQRKALAQKINATRQKLKLLREQRDQIDREILKNAHKVVSSRKYEAHQLRLKMLVLAVERFSVPEIAAKLNITRHSMACKIASAWRTEFPEHYESSRDALRRNGILTVLRKNPPPISQPQSSQ